MRCEIVNFPLISNSRPIKMDHHIHVTYPALLHHYHQQTLLMIIPIKGVLI